MRADLCGTAKCPRTGLLNIAARKGIAKAADLSDALPNLKSAQRTYQVHKLVDRKMLQPIHPGARQYTLGFSNSFLMRGIIRALSAEGFIPATLDRRS